MRLPVKPLSVNKVFASKKGVNRWKTKEYKQYEKDVCLLLRPMKIPEGPLELIVNFGVSNMRSDVDNPVKPFLDCLQKKYGFNDSQVHRLVAEKHKVPKGEEFIDFEIRELESTLSVVVN